MRGRLGEAVADGVIFARRVILLTESFVTSIAVPIGCIENIFSLHIPQMQAKLSPIRFFEMVTY